MGKSSAILTEAALKLEEAGADFLIICTNTMHKVVPLIERKIHIPIIHIADATADILDKHHIKKVALLGTKYTMTQDFYRERIEKRGIQVIVPEMKDIEIINHVIFHELCLGRVEDSSREKYIQIIEKLAEKGAEGVILGCTEIGLLIKEKDSSIPVFDTTIIHGKAAAIKALESV